jgi:hypothetical protein
VLDGHKDMPETVCDELYMEEQQDWKSAETCAAAEVEDCEGRTLMLIAGYGAPFPVDLGMKRSRNMVNGRFQMSLMTLSRLQPIFMPFPIKNSGS